MRNTTILLNQEELKIITLYSQTAKEKTIIYLLLAIIVILHGVLDN